MSDQVILAAAPLVAIGGLLALLSAIDLAGRGQHEVNGPRAIWGASLLAIPLGPILYLWFARKRNPRS